MKEEPHAKTTTDKLIERSQTDPVKWEILLDKFDSGIHGP